LEDAIQQLGFASHSEILDMIAYKSAAPLQDGAGFIQIVSHVIPVTAASDAALHIRENSDIVNIRLSAHFLSSIGRSLNSSVLDPCFRQGF